MPKRQVKKETSDSKPVAGFDQFVKDFRATGRGEQPAPKYAGDIVYASEKAKTYWQGKKK